MDCGDACTVTDYYKAHSKTISSHLSSATSHALALRKGIKRMVQSQHDFKPSSQDYEKDLKEIFDPDTKKDAI